MRSFASILILLLLLPWAAAADEGAGVFYQWMDANGALSVTDDREAIPPAYRDSVQVRTWEEVRANTQERITPSGPPAQVYFSAPVLTPKDTSPDCSKSITVQRVRVQEGDHNLPVYLVIDACGQVLSRTRTNPDIQIIRP